MARRREEQAVELEQQRATAPAEFSSQRSDLQDQMVTLRQVESDHRGRLRRHFTGQLSGLDNLTGASVQKA